jgi:beta-galactosidase
LNGNVAAVQNSFGRGKTLLMGSFPGAGYFAHHGPATKELFAGFLKIANITAKVALDDHSVQARLHGGAGATVLWVTNPTRVAKTVTATLAAAGEFKSGEDLWGGSTVTCSGRQVTMSVGARDAVVVRLG